MVEMSGAILFSVIWLFVRNKFLQGYLFEIEPMLVGLVLAVFVHFIGLLNKFFSFKHRQNN